LADARLQWIEECGHVPHLEQPEETADAIANFVASTSSTKELANASQQGPPTYIVGAGFFGALAVSSLLNVLSQ